MKKRNFKKRNRWIALMLLAASVTIISAQEPEWQWAESVNSDYGKSVRGLSTDCEGNVYVTGCFNTYIEFGDIRLHGTGGVAPGSDVFVAKMDNTGEWVMAQRAHGSHSNTGLDIAVDNNGNIYVTGRFIYDCHFGDTFLRAGGNQDIFVAKMNNEGEWLWAKRAGGGGNTSCESIGIVLDNEGNIYITGNYSSQVRFGDIWLISDGTSDNIFVAKMDSEGEWLWAEGATGDGNSESNGIVMDNEGNFYIAGHFRDNINFGETELQTEYTGYAAFAAKINNEGEWLWAVNVDGQGDTYGNGISINTEGNSLIVGYVGAYAIFGETELTHGAAYVAQIDSEGQWIWAKGIDGTGNARVESIVTDESNYNYLTGSLRREGIVNFGDIELLSSENYDIFVAKIDSEGQWLWAKNVEAGEDNSYSSYRIHIDFRGNGCITGLYSGEATFGEIELPGSGDTSDIFIAKLGPYNYPNNLGNPLPSDNAMNISVALDSLSWNYEEISRYTNPAGFRVYFNSTGEFGEDDGFHWVPYIEDQESFSTGDILPDTLDYGTKYYWKVISTTRENGIGEGLDALNCPVWSFVTELNPIPSTAVNPFPASDSVGVALGLENLRWEYIVDTTKVNPQGFRVYFNNTGEFGEDDDFEWMPFIENQQIYSNSDILPGQLQRGTIYYWQVIPTTKQDGVGEGNDAANCPLWRFVSEPLLYPAISLNPYPADDSVGVTIDLISLEWDYIEDPRHISPLGFRVYFDTDDEFAEDDFFWVPYVEEQVEYQCADILPERLDRETTYYWKVVPTTNEPSRIENGERRARGVEQRVESRERRARGVERRAESIEQRVESRERRTRDRRQIDKNSQLTTRNSQLIKRGDAENVPVWSFTTEGETDIEDSMISCPYVTRLDGNYPNPFNPETTISFSLAEPGNVTIEIFNLKGQKVKTIMNEYLDRGHHKVFWNGRDENNRKVGSGLYFYRMQTQEYIETRRMILLK